MDTVRETEDVLRTKLEASGEMNKMRAMVVEASLQALTEKGGTRNDFFSPSEKFTHTKNSLKGKVSFELIHEFLEYCGLGYTSRVLQLESGLKMETARSTLGSQLGLNASTEGPLLFDVIGEGIKDLSESKVPPPAKAVASEEAKQNVSAAVAAVLGKTKDGGEETPYFISKFEGREFTRVNQIAGQQIQLECLKRCTVLVLDPLDSVTVDEVEDCELIFAACEGSIFLRDCKNTKVTAACKQLRTRDCTNLDLRLFAGTDPVVETSTNVRFRPFNLQLPNLQENFKVCRLNAAMNRFVHVYDFSADDGKIPQPHFVVDYPDHGLKMESKGSAHGKPDAPVEIEKLLTMEVLPAASSESGQSKSYNIKTGAAAWSAENSTPAPVTAAPTSTGPAEAGGYSSFEESDSDSDDKYEVESDDDEF